MKWGPVRRLRQKVLILVGALLLAIYSAVAPNAEPLIGLMAGLLVVLMILVYVVPSRGN